MAALCSLLASTGHVFGAQDKPPAKPAEKSSQQPVASEPQLPAQFTLLETHVRFETNGDSRKEVHAIVKINDELGVNQFARLNFDYNRSFQNVEIPFVRITHTSGGTADILPSAVSDNPNPAVINAPAYQDVRVKSVRILGLAPDDTLEYRVITTVSHHPLAPDFWLDHSFDRTGVVFREIFELDLPASRKPEVRINPATPANSFGPSRDGESSRLVYYWERPAAGPPKAPQTPNTDSSTDSDVAVSTQEWELLSIRLDERLSFDANPLGEIGSYEQGNAPRTTPDVPPQVAAKALELTKEIQTNKGKLEAIYDFVSKQIATIDLPLGASGFIARSSSDILASSYATPEDKFALFRALSVAVKLSASAGLTGYCGAKGVARPSVFKHLLIAASDGRTSFWLDPSIEVAPFGLVPPTSGKCAFVLNRFFFVMNSTGHEWEKLETDPPFPSTQRVLIDAALGSDGTLKSKVHYSMRGQNELLLRIAFHQTPKEKWNDVAQLLALSDGFRGKILSATASDPYATKEPFTVEYEIEQPKFVDWSKKPVRIPALLPLLGLPDPPAAGSPIQLGTPLDVQTTVTLHLPPGTTAHVPTATSVERDYATFSSQYAAHENIVTASRHIHFLLREVPAARAADYNAFLHAVQSDQSQRFTLDRPSTPAPPAQPPVTPLPSSLAPSNQE